MGAIDDLDFSDIDDDDYDRARNEQRCKLCGERDLFWAEDQMSGRWHLVDGENKLHVCKKGKWADPGGVSSADEFEET